MTNQDNRHFETTMQKADRDIDWHDLYQAFCSPFQEAELRFRAGATNKSKTKALALPYVDPRAYEDRLNALVPGHWQVEFRPWGNERIICHLTIHGVSRSSTGEASDSPEGIAGTAAEAQAFKRACAKFGLGRYLYAIEPRWVGFDPATGKLETPVDLATDKTTHRGDAKATVIGLHRASRLRRELSKLDGSTTDHVGYASRVLGRRIDDLANLTEAEARRVWNAARLRSSSTKAA